MRFLASLEPTTSEYFINFFKQFIGTSAILIGLFTLIGCALQRKKITEIITSTIKTIIGFIIIGAGAGFLASAVAKLGSAFNLLLGVSGVISNNDSVPGIFLENLSHLVLAGSLIMIVAMFLNILLARITNLKYIYLSGHVLFYMSVMLASVFYVGGLDKEVDIPIIVISGSLILSLWMIISPAFLNKYVVQITNSNDIAIAHTGSLAYLFSAWVGLGVAKVHKKLNKKIVSTEDIKFPKTLSFLRNTNVAIAITMFFIYLIIYIAAWIAKGYQGLVLSGVIASQDDVIVQGLLQAFVFAAGVEILLIGVRMFIAEVVPSFKGISQKLVPSAKAALDCPTIFPYAPNAVLIGFISSFVGALLAMTITIGITSALPIVKSDSIGWAIILPSIVPHFFIGASSGVFANKNGGIWAAVLGPFLSGLLMSFVPFIFFGLEYMPTVLVSNASGQKVPSSITWGDSDYLLGVPFSFIGKIVGRNTFIWLLPTLAAFLWLIYPVINLSKKLLKIKDKNAKVGDENFDQKQEKKLEKTKVTNEPKDLFLKSNVGQRNKLMAVCGQGLGSSLLIEINLKTVLRDMQIQIIEVDHTNVNSFNKDDPKILAVVCGVDLANSIDFDNKIILNNLLDRNELKNKLKEFLQKNNFLNN